MKTHTYRTDAAVIGETVIYAAVEAARAAGCDRFEIVAPLPQIWGQPARTGSCVAKRGLVSRPTSAGSPGEADHDGVEAAGPIEHA